MVKLLKNHSKKAGLRPGAIVFVGDKKIDQTRIRVIDYDETNLGETELAKIEDCAKFKDPQTISWINIDGLHDTELFEKLGKMYDIHPLILEDIVNTGQRPKLEAIDQHIFITMKMLYLDNKTNHVLTEQFSFLIGSGYVISFQERVGDVFEPVRERLRKTIPRVRFMIPAYLAYALIDAVVDNYYSVLEDISNKIEDMEEVVINQPDPKDLEIIHDLKRQLIHIRKGTWPLREMIGGFERLDNDLVPDQIKPYLRDLYEHVIQVIDTIETFRDMVSGLLDIYLTSVSNKMNEVMKVLTIIATIFIPLGFLAGVYGMNFDTTSGLNMPELGLPFGYILFWGLVLMIGGGLFVFFKRKKWL